MREMERILSSSIETPKEEPKEESKEEKEESNEEINEERGLYEEGELLSLLYRIQKLLLFNTIHFEKVQLKQLQEDLRDVANGLLTHSQKLLILERISRTYSFLMARPRSWGSALIS